jgi:carbon-monoxide dehydrogenase medium subunit
LRASDTEVLMPASAAEAVEAFGDGHAVTVFAGGTILMPAIAYGRYPRGGRTLLLARAGMDEISGDSTVTIGAMARLTALADSGLEPLAAAAADVGDLEVRGLATLGGNLCAPPGTESPRGDLQAPLLAVGARVRSAGAGGERTEPVEDFLAHAANGQPRLVLAIEVDRPSRATYLSQRRMHAHSYAVMSVACAETVDGMRVAVGGVGPRGVRLGAVERALSDGASPAEAGARALDDIEPADDALASAWYRRTVLPTIVTRALEQIGGG